MPVAFGVVAPFAGRAADRSGARLPTVAGMLVAAASLGALGLVRPSGAALLAGLAVLGVGLGLFTPANNAAIMGSAPRRQAGVASGLLNMTRGMGTATGQALAALILSVAAAGLVHPATVVTGFGTCAICLAVASMVAAGLAALRGGEPLESVPSATG